MTQPRHIFRWDLDKTYLRTDFDTLRGLFKAMLEKPHEKRAVPGAPALLKALRQAGGGAHRIAIISGSPEQMRTVLEAKLQLDGVVYDEFTLKPNLQNILRWRFRAIRAQVPYKLPVLLRSRAAVQAPRETLFGDDAESDALIYCLYADILAGKVSRDALADVLRVAEAYDDQIDEALVAFDAVEKQPVVGRVLIHLDRRSPTARFDRFGPLLVPVYNYFQAALVMYGDGQLSARDLLAVSQEMLASKSYTVTSLANSLQDLMLRGRLARDVAVRLQGEAADAGRDFTDLPPQDQVSAAFAKRVQALGDHKVPTVPEAGEIDYAALVRSEGMR